MRNYIVYSLVLFLVVGISCGVLAYVNELTEPIIKENNQRKEDEARRAVFPGAERFEYIKNGDLAYYKVYDIDEMLIGYTIVAIGPGYSSDIQTMVGLNPDLSIININIIYQNETPGLGDKYSNAAFYDQFVGKSRADMRLDKDGGKIPSKTGATVTARAIVKSVGEYIRLLENELEIRGTNDNNK